MGHLPQPDPNATAQRILIPSIPQNLPGNRHPGVTELFLERGTNNAVNVRSYRDTTEQHWRLTKVGTDTYHIRSIASGDYLTYQIPGRYQGSCVLRNGAPSHTWKISTNGTEARIQPSDRTSFALDSCDQDTAHFWYVSSGVHQKWGFFAA